MIVVLDCPSHKAAVSSSPADESAASLCCSALGTDDLSCQPCCVAPHSASAADCCPLYITKLTLDTYTLTVLSQCTVRMTEHQHCRLRGRSCQLTCTSMRPVPVHQQDDNTLHVTSVPATHVCRPLPPADCLTPLFCTMSSLLNTRQKIIK